MIHPFAHMSSNYAAARLLHKEGTPARRPEGFEAVLRSVPARDSIIGLSSEVAPGRSRAGQAPDSDAPPAVPKADEPAPAPTRSRTGQGEAPAPERPQSSVPHFLTVPESVQYPNGPYRQAPAEHGGEWWLTNPFTGTEPWLTQGFGDPYAEVPEVDDGSPEFLAVFGPRPDAQTHPNRLTRGAAVADWERNLEHFGGVGVPEGFSQEQLDAAGELFEAWGMGRPLLYEGRYGWTATFPSAEMQGYEASPFAALEAPHLVVARYQVEMRDRGMEPAERHPFVPPQVFGEEPLSA